MKNVTTKAHLDVQPAVLKIPPTNAQKIAQDCLSASQNVGTGILQPMKPAKHSNLTHKETWFPFLDVALTVNHLCLTINVPQFSQERFRQTLFIRTIFKE